MAGIANPPTERKMAAPGIREPPSVHVRENVVGLHHVSSVGNRVAAYGLSGLQDEFRPGGANFWLTRINYLCKIGKWSGHVVDGVAAAA
jgi:hypothetical protein